MIISHRLKFAFFNIPDTGSDSIEMLIRMCGKITQDDLMSVVMGMPHTIPKDLFDPFYADIYDQFMKGPGTKDSVDYAKKASDTGTMSFLRHTTPSQAVKYGFITNDQLQAYKCFAVLRDPYERQLSAHSRMYGTNTQPTAYKTAVMDGKFDPNKNLSLVNQNVYFTVDNTQVCEPLLFEDYDDEVRRCIAAIDGYVFKEVAKADKLLPPNPNFPLTDFYDAPVIAKLDKDLDGDLTLFQQHTKIQDWKRK